MHVYVPRFLLEESRGWVLQMLLSILGQWRFDTCESQLQKAESAPITVCLHNLSLLGLSASVEGEVWFVFDHNFVLVE